MKLWKGTGLPSYIFQVKHANKFRIDEMMRIKYMKTDFDVYL